MVHVHYGDSEDQLTLDVVCKKHLAEFLLDIEGNEIIELEKGFDNDECCFCVLEED